MEQAGPKYTQLRKFEYLQEKAFEKRSGNSVFRCHNLKGIKLLSRLRLGLSHLREHKFKHGFLDSLNPICSCGQNIEISTQLLLHCYNSSNERLTFLNIIRNIDSKIFSKNDLKVTETLLYGDSSYETVVTAHIKQHSLW